MGGPVVAPAPAILQITDGHRGNRGDCCEDQGISVDSRGGSCGIICGDEYVSYPYLLFMLIFHAYIYVLF